MSSAVELQCHYKSAAYTGRVRILSLRRVLSCTANLSALHHRTPRTRAIPDVIVFVLLIHRLAWLVESEANTFWNGWDLGRKTE